jgi:hypothetical protein
VVDSEELRQLDEGLGPDPDPVQQHEVGAMAEVRSGKEDHGVNG